jgi:hypothetical protein
LGTFGEITVAPTQAGTRRASTWFRDWDGKMRRVSATGRTKAQAVSALKAKLAVRDRSGDAGGPFTADSRFGVVAALWLEEVQGDPNLSARTKEGYPDRVRRLLLPTFEHLSLREITTGRVGEALAIRRCDVDMTASPPTVHLCGTIVVLKGQGASRQNTPKTHKSDRIVAIPQFAAEVIRRRLVHLPPDDPEHLLFFTKNHTPLTPNNVRRTLRAALDQAGLAGMGVRPHSFRRTVATIISREAGEDAAAQMLGHSSTRITRQFYIEPEMRANPITATILDRLSPQPQPADTSGDIPGM